MLAVGTNDILGLIFRYLDFYLWQIDPLTPFAPLSFDSLQACLTTSTLLGAQDNHFIGSLDQTACRASMTLLPSRFLATLLRAPSSSSCAYPSVEGGLLLLWLSLPARPSSSCRLLLNCSTCSRNCRFSARS